MASKDLYESLIKYYEFMLGRLPNRQEFKNALKDVIVEKDLRVFFVLPFMGQLSMAEFEKKALRAGISAEELQTAVKRLIPEGFIATYKKNGKPVYERASILTMVELQIRKMELTSHESAAIRLEAARFMDLMTEGAAANVPTKTPYYRVLPVQSTLTGITPTGEVIMDALVPDPRAVLPIDVISEMIKDEPLIIVAECYCRKAKQILGKGCQHRMETCFYFNELGELINNAGRGRKVEYDEALHILRECEKEGLVHNINNAQGHIHSLCNCCSCSCGVMKAIQRGQTNASTPSRFIVSRDGEVCAQCGTCAGVCPTAALTYTDSHLYLELSKCIGCGLCVSHCPNSALRMVPREKVAPIPETVNDMFKKINREALIGMVVSKFRRN